MGIYRAGETAAENSGGALYALGTSWSATATGPWPSDDDRLLCCCLSEDRITRARERETCARDQQGNPHPSNFRKKDVSS
jgi:hypothetical protein